MTEVEPASAPAVPTKTVYSWYYYEREDQFDNLFDCLNLKGQRERKLQESLKKIKDRLKLKKAKKVAVSKLPVIPAISENQESKPAEEGHKEGEGAEIKPAVSESVMEGTEGAAVTEVDPEKPVSNVEGPANEDQAKVEAPVNVEMAENGNQEDNKEGELPFGQPVEEGKEGEPANPDGTN